MNLDQALCWRKVAGWAGTGLCLLAFLSLLDGLTAQWREPESVIKLLPGMTTEINGPLLEEVPGVQELAYFSDAEDLKLTFDSVHKGYFLGGDMWRGQIMVGSHLRPGEYHLTVAPRRSTSSRATPAFRIVVFPDSRSLQRSSKSLIRSYTGLSPWGAAAACLPGILLTFGTVLLMSQRLDRLLAQKGRAEIYRVIRKDGGFEIHFGLGTEHGIYPGLQLRVHNPQGKAVGLARVQEAAPTYAVALVTSDQGIRPGFIVSGTGS